jgi:hypothetical protein
MASGLEKAGLETDGNDELTLMDRGRDVGQLGT